MRTDYAATSAWCPLIRLVCPLARAAGVAGHNDLKPWCVYRVTGIIHTGVLCLQCTEV